MSKDKVEVIESALLKNVAGGTRKDICSKDLCTISTPIGDSDMCTMDICSMQTPAPTPGDGV